MLKIEGLTKRYGQHTVVDNLTFGCQAGEVLGFLGPNGAGKSTTMKMITGFVAPSSGMVRVCDHDVLQNGIAARQCIGYLPEGAPSYAEMTPAGFLDFIADVRGMQGSERRSRLDEVIEQLHLGPVLQQVIDTLSKGFKRRVGLAQAILHDPQVLILDEPTDGLDPNQKHEVRELIRSMSAEKLIVISTHILEEVDAVCSRAIIIADGKILADDTPANLSATSQYHNAVRLRFADNNTLQAASHAIDGLPSVSRTEVVPEQGLLTAIAERNTADGATWRDISALVATSGWSITEMQVESGRLDDVFRQVTQGGAQ